MNRQQLIKKDDISNVVQECSKIIVEKVEKLKEKFNKMREQEENEDDQMQNPQMKAFLTNIDLMGNDNTDIELSDDLKKESDDANTTYHALTCIEKLLKLDDAKTAIS